ncbi:AAA family ATPase [Amycolatopsis sp. OK19-0408]|uniref:AAA family ATPase n=1 Tax=Amycolatopsis iheyensis TaxID=2945988 RepID=A0A9X2N6D9_9PSEU|nr:AAA family ATPase [Amycolatopsis iheyensis]MCR6481678.1 AAA family ATPase [Amycolatopsis iheyensis]
MNEPLDPPQWWIYHGTGIPPASGTVEVPVSPPWRNFRSERRPETDVVPPDDGEMERRLGGRSAFSVPRPDPDEVNMVNAAIYLRRPLLVTGRPGSGKSTLAFKIARELGLGRVLQWPIASHTTVKTGLYGYDAIGRAQAAAGARAAMAGEQGTEPAIGEFVRLGELGTAFLPRRAPRVLLIDELDKSEADLPNDLLSLFEDGEFSIPELVRLARRTSTIEVFTADPEGTAEIENGRVRCSAFPIVVITSNGERDFPPAFLRRCLHYETKAPDIEQLTAMVAAHLPDPADELRSRIIEEFSLRSVATGGLPSDKLMEAVHLATSGAYQENGPSWNRLLDALWRQINPTVP